MKILVVEDDQQTGYLLAEELTKHHFTVNLATNGETGLALAQHCEYDLMLLDIVIPKIDGISLCQKLRSEGFQTPILLLTAKDSSTDRVLGLDAGADDYMVKPFDLSELMARIRALLRRTKAGVTAVIRWENIQLDDTTCEVTCGNRLVHLTSKEYCLLELFLQNPKRIFNRRAILDRLWDFAETPGEETVSTHIKCLRQKLKAAGASDPIETVHGLGYRLKAPAQGPEPALPDLLSQPQTPVEPSPADAIASRVWEKFKDKFDEQIVLLEQLTHTISNGQATPETYQQAQHLAHQFAGSLGIFGYTEGSHIAREMEALLQAEQQLSPNALHQLVSLMQSLKQQQQDRHCTMPVVSAKSLLTNAPRILIVDDDLALAERIRIEAIAWNLRVEIATEFDAARRIITQTPPSVILLDLNFPNTQDDGLTFLEELSQRTPTLPVVIFTKRESLQDRVRAAQMGGYAFLHKPVPPYQILKTITDALNLSQDPGRCNRVMIVDDDVSTLERLSALLQSQDVEVVSLEQPEKFWDVLTETNPNLVLLDLEMPGFNGIELCQAVRSDPHWRDLPVLFLSAHADDQVVNQAFAAGADDYISKSSDTTELMTRIIRRCSR